MRTGLHYLVHSNVWIALGAPLLVWVTCSELGLSYPWPFAAFSFFTVLLSYNLQRWLRWGEGPVRLPRKGYAILILVSGLASAVLLFFFDAALFLLLIPLALISLLYAWPMPGMRKGLRDLPFLKLFLIAFSWTYLSVLLPVWSLGEALSLEALSLSLERFFFFLAITIPFDIRDLPFDDPDKRTVPQLLGVKRGKWVALGALFLFWGGMGWRTLQLGAMDLSAFTAFTLTGVLTGIVVYGSGPSKGELYYSGLLDGTMHLQFLLLMLLGWMG